MGTARGQSGDGERKRSIKKTEKRSPGLGGSLGRRDVIPEGFTGKSKKAVKRAVRKPPGLK